MFRNVFRFQLRKNTDCKKHRESKRTPMAAYTTVASLATYYELPLSVVSEAVRTMRTAKTMSRPTDFTTVACSMRSDPKKTAYFNNLRYAKRDNNDSTFCAFCKS